MATLFYCVFETAGAVALGDPIQEGVITITSVANESVPISGEGKKRRRVRLYPDADCFVTWGENPTALTDGTNGRPMSAEGTEYFDIESGHQISVIERV